MYREAACDLFETTVIAHGERYRWSGPIVWNFCSRILGYVPGTNIVLLWTWSLSLRPLLEKNYCVHRRLNELIRNSYIRQVLSEFSSC